MFMDGGAVGAEQQIGTDRGCADNGATLKIACRLTGPASTDQTGQLAELETLLTSDQVDCLGIQSPLPDAFVDIINKFVDAGIPVFFLLVFLVRVVGAFEPAIQWPFRYAAKPSSNRTRSFKPEKLDGSLTLKGMRT